jgi:hypothetical protein
MTEHELASEMSVSLQRIAHFAPELDFARPPTLWRPHDLFGRRRMRIIALIHDSGSAHRILRHLGMRAHPPPVAPARVPGTDFHAA